MTRTERTYYFVFGLYNLSAWLLAPIYATFLMSRGLDLFEINVVLATYLITTFAFEVPTGAIADLVGRRVSFLSSCVVRAGAYSLYAFARDFSDCLIAEFVDGIGTALASGAIEAWAIEGMRAEGDRSATDRFFARSQILVRTTMILGGVACGYLAGASLRLPWLAGAAGFAVTGVLGARWMREGVSAGESANRSLGRMIVKGFRTVRGVPLLALLCVLSMVAPFAAIPAHMLWQPRVQGLTGEGTWLLGWIWALISLAAAIGSAALPRLLERFRRESVLCAAALWRGSMLALAAAGATLSPVLAGFLLQEVSFGLSEPLLMAWMNEHIPAESRATVLSVRSMFGTLGGAAGLLAIGVVARDFGVSAAWSFSAAVFTVMAPGFLLLGRLGGRVRPAPSATKSAPVPAKVMPPVLPSA